MPSWQDLQIRRKEQFESSKNKDLLDDMLYKL